MARHVSRARLAVGSTVEVASSRHNFEGKRGNVLRYDVKQGLCRVSLTMSGGQRRTHQLPPALLRVIPSALLLAGEDDPALSSGPLDSAVKSTSADEAAARTTERKEKAAAAQAEAEAAVQAAKRRKQQQQ